MQHESTAVCEMWASGNEDCQMFVIGWSAACKDLGGAIPLANGRRRRFFAAETNTVCGLSKFC